MGKGDFKKYPKVKNRFGVGFLLCFKLISKLFGVAAIPFNYKFFSYVLFFIRIIYLEAVDNHKIKNEPQTFQI